MKVNTVIRIWPESISDRETLRKERKKWRTFVKVCRDYATLGLTYSTQIVCRDGLDFVVVQAHGEPTIIKPRPPKLKPWRDTGRPLTLDQCRKRVAEARERLKKWPGDETRADLEYCESLEALALERERPNCNRAEAAA